MMLSAAIYLLGHFQLIYLVRTRPHHLVTLHLPRSPLSPLFQLTLIFLRMILVLNTGPCLTWSSSSEHSHSIAAVVMVLKVVSSLCLLSHRCLLYRLRRVVW